MAQPVFLPWGLAPAIQARHPHPDLSPEAMMAQANAMFQAMDPDQRRQIEELIASMPESEQQAMVQRARDMGLI